MPDPVVSRETFVPTVQLGFIERSGRQILHQAWVGTLGTVEWRKVAMVDKGSKPGLPCTVGAVDMEAEDATLP